MDMKHNELIEELSKLTLQEKSLKRNLDVCYYDSKKREKLFKEIDETKNKIKKIKFKIRLEREIKNEKFR